MGNVSFKRIITVTLFLVILYSNVLIVHGETVEEHLNLDFTGSTFLFEYGPRVFSINLNLPSPLPSIDWRLTIYIRLDATLKCTFMFSSRRPHYVKPSSEIRSEVSVFQIGENSQLEVSLRGYINFEDISGGGRHSKYIDLSSLNIRERLQFTAPLGQMTIELPKIPVDLLSLMGLGDLTFLSSLKLYVEPKLFAKGVINGNVEVIGETSVMPRQVVWKNNGEGQVISGTISQSKRDGEQIDIKIKDLKYDASYDAYVEMYIKLETIDFPIIGKIERRWDLWESSVPIPLNINATCSTVISLLTIIDALPPNVENLIMNPLKPNYKESVNVRCTSKDQRSGVRKLVLHYSVNRGGSLEEKEVLMNRIAEDTYEATIPPQPYNSEVQYFVYAEDNVGNGYKSTVQRYLVIDNIEPTIENIIQSPEKPSLFEQVVIKSRVKDDGSGVSEVLIYYSTDGGITWKEPIQMKMIGGDTYEGTIAPQQLGTKVVYYIEASDKAGNKAKTQQQSFYVELGLKMTILVIALFIFAIGSAYYGAIYLRRKRKRPPPPPPPPPVEVCPNCGAPIEPYAASCKKCGTIFLWKELKEAT
ncbi:MAG: zinc ribbon domain-containing protein [Candidatus Methanomethylicia archaeon]